MAFGRRPGRPCCHPALAPEARVALALRTLAGLDVAAIARAFGVPEQTMAKRLVRARRKIAAAQIPYKVPGDSELPARLPTVLAVVYLRRRPGAAAGPGPVPLGRRAHRRGDLAAGGGGPALGRGGLDSIDGLDRSHLWHAARADALRRLGRGAAAAAELRTAIGLAPAAPDRRLLEARLGEARLGEDCGEGGG